MFENVFYEAKLFFFLKTYRLIAGLKAFNVSRIIDKIKDAGIEEMEKKI